MWACLHVAHELDLVLHVGLNVHRKSAVVGVDNEESRHVHHDQCKKGQETRCRQNPCVDVKLDNRSQMKMWIEGIHTGGPFVGCTFSTLEYEINARPVYELNA